MHGCGHSACVSETRARCCYVSVAHRVVALRTRRACINTDAGLYACVGHKTRCVCGSGTSLVLLRVRGRSCGCSPALTLICLGKTPAHDTCATQHHARYVSMLVVRCFVCVHLCVYAPVYPYVRACACACVCMCVCVCASVNTLLTYCATPQCV